MAAETEVQKALYSALTALGLRVYDTAPQAADGASTATFPYVEVGQVIMADFDTKDRNGFDFVARIHTRSKSGSMAEAKGIQGQMYAVLHNGDLTMSGLSSVLLRRENSFCDRVTDGSFHGVCEYRGLIETF
jgi:hypothetical protein